MRRGDARTATFGGLAGPDAPCHGRWAREAQASWPAAPSPKPLPLSRSGKAEGGGEAAIGHREGLQPPGGLAE